MIEHHIARIAGIPYSNDFRVVYPDGHVSKPTTEKQANDAVNFSRRQYLSKCITYALGGYSIG